ncbi:MAG TPA: hypothetical protein VF398_10715 [bacterium]|jgi:hypothetical protein
MAMLRELQGRGVELLNLAKSRFENLSKAEENLYTFIGEGYAADYLDKTDESKNNPAIADIWPIGRVLDAKCIQWLCTDKHAIEFVPSPGIWISGARITGELDLMFWDVPFPLIFKSCSFTSDIILKHTKIRYLLLSGTHTRQIHASGVHIQRNMDLKDGFLAAGQVNLSNATIGGDLNLVKASFINPEGFAINADGINVKGDAFLRNEFTSRGEVRFIGASIGGSLDCGNAHFFNSGKIALGADKAKIGGDVFLNDGFYAEGEVRFVGTTVGAGFDCSSGQFINDEGKSINANKLSINGSFQLDENALSRGAIHLHSATVEGNITFMSSSLENISKFALYAEGLRVRGSVNLCDELQIEGTIGLIGATIGGHLRCSRIDPTYLILDLRSTSIKTLIDDSHSWPNAGNLIIDGFQYQEFGDGAPYDAESRLDWIRRQPGDRFYPQPYEQLSSVLQKCGQDDDAKKVLIAKSDDKARMTKLPLGSRIWHRILGWTIGYGYRPMKALQWMLAAIIVGWILFSLGSANCSMLPLSNSSPAFNALFYSIDTFLPLLDLQQANYWYPIAPFLSWYLLLHTLLGWILTSLFVGGLTRLIRS